MNQKSITPNPYEVLEVSPGASNKEITVAFAMAMKRRKYSPDAIALARKSLMNPEERIIADYLRSIVTTVKRFKRSELSALDTPAPKLEFLSEFNGLEQGIADSNKVSESDQRLGAMLFADSPIQTKVTQDNSFAKSSTEYSNSFVKKQDIKVNLSNSKTISILPWLSVLFVFLLMLFIWGVFNKFQYASSPQVESTPTEITTESQISSQSEESIIPEITDRQNTQPRALAYDFPLNFCGDKDPGGANSWYPVYVQDTPENLNRIKAYYCRDAIPKYREEKAIQSIQVASFLNQKKAQEFADLMLRAIGSGEVGEPSVYDFDNK